MLRCRRGVLARLLSVEGERRAPHLRPGRRPEPFEALAWAVCEQLIDIDRAAEIQRRIVGRWGRRCPATGLRDVPDPAALAGAAPAELEACGLTAAKAIAMVRAAREVATGRADLHAPDHERAWRRLRAVRASARGRSRCSPCAARVAWTRCRPVTSACASSSLGCARAATRARGRGRGPRLLRASFAPYAPWAGLAARHALNVMWPGPPAPV